MSNFLAIATVTAALSDFLSEALLAAGVDLGGASATTLRPDVGIGLPAPGVNIFLYQVTPNAAWRNVDLPTRRANGELIQRSQAALDLHYLLTCYGDDAKLEPQRVLGVVVRALHTQPVLTRELIRRSILGGKFKVHIPQSNLADAVELVRLTPLSLSLEELSKLWSVYFQTHYSLSIAYQASVVLIESEDSTHAALPVRARNIYVAPFRQPLIETVRALDGDEAFITSASTLIVIGNRLRSEMTLVRVGGFEVTPAVADVSDKQISLPLTLPLLSDLGSGVQGLQVVQPMLIGTPPVAHSGVESNLMAFVLHPTIKTKPDPGFPPDIEVSSPAVATDSSISADVTVKVSPRASKTQRAVLLLNQLVDPPSVAVAQAYSFNAASRSGPDPTDTLTFSISGVVPGDYLVRLQIDGATSPLERNQDENNPRYSGPKVTIP